MRAALLVLLAPEVAGQYCTQPDLVDHTPPRVVRGGGVGGSDSDPPFSIVWNMPTAPCALCPNASDHVEPERFGVTVNKNESEYGDEIVCLYEFGLPPRLKASNLSAWPTPLEDITVVQNGGVPQAPSFNMSLHLATLAKDIERRIPDPDFAGLALVDKEGWSPLFCGNWVSGDSRYYNIYSEALVQAAHPSWNATRVRATAAEQWDAASKDFYLQSIQAARRLRPKARWGYFATPTAPPGARGSAEHKAGVKALNARLGWLFSAVDFLAPLIYVTQRPEQRSPSQNLTAWAAAAVGNAISVADEVAAAGGKRPAVLPYGSIVYRDLSPAPPPSVPQPFMEDRVGLAATVQVPAALGAEGVILWGSGSDTNICHPNAGCLQPICERCGVLAAFMDGSSHGGGGSGGAGEVMASCVSERAACSRKRCRGHGRCVDADLALIDTVCVREATSGGECRCDEGWSGHDCSKQQEVQTLVGVTNGPPIHTPTLAQMDACEYSNGLSPRCRLTQTIAAIRRGEPDRGRHVDPAGTSRLRTEAGVGRPAAPRQAQRRRLQGIPRRPDHRIHDTVTRGTWHHRLADRGTI